VVDDHARRNYGNFLKEPPGIPREGSNPLGDGVGLHRPCLSVAESIGNWSPRAPSSPIGHDVYGIASLPLPREPAMPKRRERIWHFLLGISTDNASCTRRGFVARERSRRERLEEIGRTFIEGYNAALRLGDPEEITPQLGAVVHELEGFACEGAAMGFAVLDLLTPRSRRRFLRFLAGPARHHIYMAHVGAGLRQCRFEDGGNSWIGNQSFCALDGLSIIVPFRINQYAARPQQPCLNADRLRLTMSASPPLLPSTEPGSSARPKRAPISRWAR
jgi:hypothetical protein